MPICPILAGRATELQRLESALNGPGEVLLVTGEAGIGKSRLLREFARRVSDSRRAVVWARPEEVTAPGPYSLILDLLENLAAGAKRAAASEARTLMDDLVDPTFASQPRAASLPRHVAARVRGLVGGEPSPVLVLEDLHAADEASHAVIMHLARTASDDGRLLIATYRDAASSAPLSRLVAALERDRVGTEIRLAPLPTDAVREMVAAILGDEPSAEMLDEIARLGEGIPFFIEELAGEDAPHTAAAATVPETIQRSVLARLDELPEAVRDAIRSAALIEGAIDFDILRAAHELSASEITEGVSAARDLGLIEERHGETVFRHGIIRVAVASSMSTLVLRAHHERIANAIESVYPKEDARAGQLAHHRHEAGDAEHAATDAIAAGRHALTFAATAAARSLFENALAWTSSEDVRLAALDGLSQVEFRDGNTTGAIEHLRRSAETLRGAGRPVQAAVTLGRLALVLTRTTESDLALGTLDEAMSLMPEGDDSPELARLLAQKGNVLAVVLGRFADAEPHLTKAAAMAARLEEAAVRAIALDGLSAVAEWRGDFQLCHRLGSEAVAEAMRSGDGEAIGKTHNNLGYRLSHHGEMTRGLSVMQTGKEILARSYGAAPASFLATTIGKAYQEKGEPVSAMSAIVQPESMWMRWKGYAIVVQVWAHLQFGEEAEAATLLRRAWDDAGSDPEQAVRSNLRSFDESLPLLYAQTLLQLHAGAGAVTVEAARTLLRSATAIQDPTEILVYSTFLAEALLQAVGAQEAAEALMTLKDQLRRWPFVGATARAQSLQAAIAKANGDTAGAAERWLDAATTFGRIENMSDRAKCLRLAAEVLDEATARPLLKQARDLAAEAGATAELARVEATMRGIGMRPRSGRPRRGEERLGGLSVREEQVAVLVAAGATNAEISKRLFLSEGTVADHITAGLRKLGLPGRAGLAAWCAKQGLA